MNMVIPDEGKPILLTRALSNQDSAAMALRVQLYKNDYTPVNGSVFASFTAADFTGSGYIDIAGDGSGWDAATVASNVAQKDLTVAPSWTNTGASQTVYGWFLWDVGTGKVLMAQRFDSARVLATGATETLDPFRIKLKTFA